MPSLKKKAYSGAIWTFFGFGLSQFFRLVNNLILTRLLVPEFFGLMAIINSLILGFTLFSDFGIGQTIIQNKRGDDPNFLNTAWTLQVIRGSSLWLICILIASQAANFYQEEQLKWLFPITGLTLLFSGFNSTAIFSLKRRVEVRKSILFELTVQIIGLATMIIWAMFNPTIWSLVIGSLVSSILKMVGSYWLIPGTKNRFAWHKDSLQGIISFGKWMFLATTMVFLAEQSDRLILGKLIPLEILGVYTVAFTFANIPRQIIKRIGNQVIFPVISLQKELSRATLRLKILRQRRKMLLGVILFLAIMVSFGDFLVTLLYDERYIDASWMLPILALGVWFSVLFYTSSPCLLGLGKPVYAAQGNFCRFLTISLGLIVGYNLAGVPGAIVVIAISDLPAYLAIQYGLWREKILFIKQDMQATALFFGFITFLLWIRSLVGLGLPINHLLN